MCFWQPYANIFPIAQRSTACLCPLTPAACSSLHISCSVLSMTACACCWFQPLHSQFNQSPKNLHTNTRVSLHECIQGAPTSKHTAPLNPHMEHIVSSNGCSAGQKQASATLPTRCTVRHCCTAQRAAAAAVAGPYLRSSLMSWSALFLSGVPVGGMRGLWSGKVSSSRYMITADSVTTRPSISSTGSRPDGTCKNQDAQQYNK